jgi:hypothetical protein
MKRFLCLGAVLFLCVFWAGCGDVFRPIIIPNPPQFPNPAAVHTVVTLGNNGTATTGGAGVPAENPLPGSAMVIDNSGDSVVSIKSIGLNPVHAVLQSSSDALVVNQSVVTDQTPLSGTCVVTIDGQNFNVCPTLTKLQFSGTTINNTSTITLPPNSAANFVATTESSEAYVSLPNLFLDPVNHPSAATVAVVNTTNNSMTTEVMVGNNPIAMAETPDGTKLYVANQGSQGIPSTWTISAFNTKPSMSTRTICDPTGTKCPPPLGSAPIWISARSDSQQVYVLESNGTLAYLNTSLTGSDTFAETGIDVPGAAYMWYDTILNRLYIPGGSQLVIVDVSQSAPTVLATIDIPAFAILPTGTTAPATAVAVTSLPDGSRAYVGSFAVLPSDFTISSVSGDGTTATYAYTLTAGHDLTPGVTVSITGTGFDGTFLVAGVVSGTSACPGRCFQVPNATSGTGTAGSGTGSNIFPQVTVVDTTSNTKKPGSVGIPGFPDATNSSYASGIYYVPACASTRFRFTMAAAGDSSRAYLGNCDGGNVNIIYTTTDTYAENVAAPGSVRNPIPPSIQNPPQNPTFIFAGP